METRDLRRWFDEAELGPCPRCREQTALKTPKGGFILCFECGIVGIKAEDEDGAVPTTPEA